MTRHLSVEQVDHAARLLTVARIQGDRLADLGSAVPLDELTAEAIADRHAEQIGWDVVGWKVGCTSEHAMKLLGSPGPFAGRIFAGTRHASASGAVVGLREPKVESEFAFVLGSDLPSTGEPYSVEEVRAATATVAPAIELVDTRFEDFNGVGYLSLIADSGANAGIVTSDPVPVADLPDLATVAVVAEVDGAETGRGTGADVLGDPWNALAWLANHLSRRRIPLLAGQLVMSGTCTGVASLPSGSTATARYDGLGSVSVTRAE